MLADSEGASNESHMGPGYIPAPIDLKKPFFLSAVIKDEGCTLDFSPCQEGVIDGIAYSISEEGGAYIGRAPTNEDWVDGPGILGSRLWAGPILWTVDCGRYSDVPWGCLLNSIYGDFDVGYMPDGSFDMLIGSDFRQSYASIRIDGSDPIKTDISGWLGEDAKGIIRKLRNGTEIITLSSWTDDGASLESTELLGFNVALRYMIWALHGQPDDPDAFLEAFLSEE